MCQFTYITISNKKNLDKPKKNRKNIFANSQNPNLCMCRMGASGLAGGGVTTVHFKEILEKI